MSDGINSDPLYLSEMEVEHQQSPMLATAFGVVNVDGERRTTVIVALLDPDNQRWLSYPLGPTTVLAMIKSLQARYDHLQAGKGIEEDLENYG